ncbi:hypothetical protein D3C73_1266830 [compost metagenome]
MFKHIRHEVSHNYKSKQQRRQREQQLLGQLARPDLQIANRTKRSEHQSMYQTEHHYSKSGYHCIRIYDIKESGIHLHVTVNRQPLDEAGEDYGKQERRQEAAEEDAGIPSSFPSQ